MELVLTVTELSFTEKEVIVGDWESLFVIVTLQVVVVELPAASVDVAVNVFVVLPKL